MTFDCSHLSMHAILSRGEWTLRWQTQCFYKTVSRPRNKKAPATTGALSLLLADWKLDGIYAALADVCAAFAAFSRASLARICDTVSCTWLSKTYCAGRWFSMAISGAIGPLVLIPRQATASALSGCFIMASAAVGS